VVDKLEETTMNNVDAYMTKKIAAGKNDSCTLETAGVRREWYVSGRIPFNSGHINWIF